MLHDAFGLDTPEDDLLELWCKDLYYHKLCGTRNIKLGLSADGALQKATTDLGYEFLRFIAEPTRDA